MGELSALPSGTKTGVCNTISAPSDSVPSIEMDQGSEAVGDSEWQFTDPLALILCPAFTGHRTYPCIITKFLLAIDPCDGN